jgi:hypothetical protein
MFPFEPQRESRLIQIAGGILLAGFLIFLSALPVSAAIDEPTVYIQSYNLTPSVLVPGDTGTLTVVIKNTATTATQRESSGAYSGGQFASEQSADIKTVIDSIELKGNGLEVITGMYERFGALGPGQSVPVTFSIRAPQKEGIYYPEVWVDINQGKSVRYPIPVNVNSWDQVLKAPALVVEKSLPDSVNPGDSFSVNLNVTNAGALRANQVTLSVNTSTTSIGVKGPNMLMLDSLDGDATKPVQLDFISDKNAPLGLQKVNLLFTYQLPDGTSKQQTETIQVPVKGKAEMNIASITTEPKTPAAGDQVNLIIRLENTGTDTAKSVSASVDLPMEGTKEAFIGKIKQTNDAPAVFTVKTTGSGDFPYTLTVKYNDEWGEHTLTRTLHFNVGQSDNIGIIIAALVIAAGAAFYFLYWRRRGAA